NNIDLTDSAKTREIYTEEEEKTVKKLCANWESFLEKDLIREKEKGVFARELDPNLKVYTVATLRRVAFIAFIAGVVSEENERLRIELRRLC
ncbi:unnamed protein product, partial [marine sediment metagenome]